MSIKKGLANSDTVSFIYCLVHDRSNSATQSQMINLSRGLGEEKDKQKSSNMCSTHTQSLTQTQRGGIDLGLRFPGGRGV